MPIDVLCTGCKTRFQVSDKFAGQKGPCPKCKSIIQVPAKTEQVVVHAPETSGPKDSKGRSVLKPLRRIETRVTPLRIGLVVGVVVTVLAFALYFRLSHDPKSPFPVWPLAAGALLVAPLTCWSGYAFLRDDELAAHEGRSLWIRTAVCSLAYAALWAAYYGVKLWLLDGKAPVSWEYVYIVPPVLAVGACVAWGGYELSYGTGLLHVGYYFIVTIALRLVAGLAIL